MFQITQSDDASNFVCFECWTTTQTFHLFYETVETAHREYFSSGLLPNDGDIDTGQSQKGKFTSNVKTSMDSNELQTFVACDMLPLLSDENTNKSSDEDIKLSIGKRKYILRFC